MFCRHGGVSINYLQAIKRYGMTRKKIRQVASQRCNALRGEFMSHTFLFQRNMFVSVDESGADRRDSLRKFGYSLRGTTPEYHRFLTGVNVLAAITSDGVLATEISTTSVNGEIF